MIGARIAAVIIGLIGSVFALAGLAMLGFAVLGNFDEQPVGRWIVAFMGVSFTAIGTFIVLRAVQNFVNPDTGERIVNSTQHVATVHAAAASGLRIPQASGGPMMMLPAFALFWNIFVGLIIALMWDQIATNFADDPKTWIIMVFPLAGLVLLVAAARSLIRRQKFSPSHLVLGRSPVPLGGELNGHLELPAEIGAARSITVRFTCYRITRSSDGNSSVPLWQDEVEAGPMSVSHDGDIVRLPVRIAVTAKAEPSSLRSDGLGVVWQVDVHAPVPGVDFAASFPVTVAGTPVTEETADTGLRRQREPISPRRPSAAASGIRRTVGMEMDMDGNYRWDFRPARVPAAASVLTLFTTGWFAILFIIVGSGAPLWVPIVFGLIGLLMLWGVLDMWLGRIVVRARQGMLERRSGYLLVWRTIRVPAQEIKDFEVRAGMSVGSKAYHDVYIQRVSFGKLRIASYLRSLREAEAIVEEVRSALGLPAQDRNGARP